MTLQLPRYSIIIPAYNAAMHVGETISSVLGQTETDWELVIVDDGSTDATAQVLTEFTDRRIAVIRQENSGVSVARNTGFAVSRGMYVLFLDADDVLFPSALYRLGKELDDHLEAVLSFGTYTRFESTPPPESAARAPIRLRRKPCGDALASLLAWNSLVTGAVLVRRQAIARVKGFDVGLTMGEDWAFWCDLAALGPIRYVGRKPVLAYRFHRDSAMRKLGVDPTALWPAIDRAFSQEVVRHRFTEKKRMKLHRRAEGSALLAVADELLRQNVWHWVPGIFWETLKRDPVWLALAGISFVFEKACFVTRKAKGFLQFDFRR
jgi:glycosyltransferase involved in cell wall biosynthesis